MSLRLPFLNASGGLAYHSLALRHQNQLWSSLQQGVEKLLDDWRPKPASLLLIGPSGGYSLSQEWLQQFQKIDVLDPDPVAAFIFQRRFSGLLLEWHRKDYFTREGRLNPQGFQLLAEDFPSHAILFCNFLGQLPLLVESSSPSPFWPTSWLSQFQEWLSGRSWASYHDLISTQTWPRKDRLHHLNRHLSAKALAGELFSDQSSPVEVTDHLTEELFSFSSAKRRRWPWFLNQRSFHVIEGLFEKS